jgi:two-component system, cell cycle sensor histidine kinase and response regulator CckA
MAKKDSHPDASRNRNKGQSEIAYYKRIASECGISRLRETDALSRLIDQRRQAEQALKKAQEELEQRVIERTAALSMANASLKREIQKRARTTDELIESEKKYRAMFEDSPDAISLTQDARIVDVNPAWLNLHGYGSNEEIVGRDIIEVIHPADRHILQKRRQAWPAVTNDGYPIRDICKDGRVLDVEIFASHISFNGRDAILSTIHDLTERNKSEAEKRKLEERLRHSEKMEAVGALAGGVAHDLNNILSGLITYPELLLFDIPDDNPLKGPLTTIKKSGEKASAVVQDLLTLARRGVPITETVNLNQIIRDYLTSPEYDRLKRYHHVQIVRSLAPDLFNIMGSSVHLSQTLMNLISNAAEAMMDGGTVTVTTRNHKVDHPSKENVPLQAGDHVLLQIADTGYGIEASDLARIFEPFYTKKVMGRSGTGLGMAVVWGTVEDHQGHIEVESEVGKGTRFSLFFPATHRQLQNQENEKPAYIPMGKGETILVVDDVVEQREVACSILGRLGYQVTAVASGEDAIAYTQDHPVDLLLLDMIIEPGIDGYETYKRFLQINSGQRAIIVSGYSNTERILKARTLGPCGYVKKPYTMESIATAVRRILDETPENP